MLGHAHRDALRHAHATHAKTAPSTTEPTMVNATSAKTRPRARLDLVLAEDETRSTSRTGGRHDRRAPGHPRAHQPHTDGTRRAQGSGHGRRAPRAPPPPSGHDVD